MKSDNEMPKQWLRNIKKIDDKNHLAHGVIYAQDGSIRSFRVAENEVEARVEGAPGDFYNVRIQFKEFTEDEKGYLVDYIKGNPIIYSRLLNNQIAYGFFECRSQNPSFKPGMISKLHATAEGIVLQAPGGSLP